MPASRPIVILSNRGPVAFHRAEDGMLAGKRGGGGLVSALAPLVKGTDATWIAAAMSDDDRAAAAGGVAEADGLRVRLLDIDAATYRCHYDTICNESLWFALHGLFDTAHHPVLDQQWWAAWEAYRSVNATFAAAAADVAPEGAAVLVQDYHLALVAPALLGARPDLRCSFVAHTPWAEAEAFVTLAGAGREVHDGIAAAHAAGFHTERWAAAYERASVALTGHRAARVFAAPLGPDADDLASVAASGACAEAKAALAEATGDRKLIVRVDRMELSKNIVRGFLAYDALLAAEPQWRERVVFVALCYPSRESVPAYAAYRHDVEATAAAVNDRWATEGWQPIVLHTDDDFPRSVAALALADVVVVNPVRDGMNLVAKEQALVGERAPVLVLSTEAGAAVELADRGALMVNPFDVRATAAALGQALAMDGAERAARHATLHEAALAATPATWLSAQLEALQ